jgi:hypothetical protein
MQTIILILLILIGGVIVFNRSLAPSIKGKLGEKRVGATLFFLPRNEYIVLNDLLFINGSYSTQIDHIVISTHGIFVIETKNYKGMICGNSNKDYWTQHIWKNKYDLYNPIFQCQNHINFLIRKFGEVREFENYIYPIVAFLGADTVQISGKDDCVMRQRQLNSYIKSRKQTIMTIEECRFIATILKTENITDSAMRENHIANVRAAQINRETKISNGICPLCGGRLIRHTGKYGVFFGCSNYPRCKYTI